MNVLEKSQLFLGLWSGEKAFVGPPYIHLDVTRRCNLHCPGCKFHASDLRGVGHPGDGPVADISLELVRQVAGEARQLSIREVILAGGGEPLLHPGLPEIVAILREAGCIVRIYTNGTALLPDGVDRILDSGVDELAVSLWASSAEEYSACYPDHPPLFEKVTAGIRALVQARDARAGARPRVSLGGPVTRGNCRNLPGRVGLAHRLGVEAVEYTAYRQTSPDQIRHLLTAAELGSVATELEEIRNLADRLGISHNTGDFYRLLRRGKTAWRSRPCYIGWLHLNIHVDGTVTPCHWCPAPIGHLGRESLVEIWNGPALQEFRRHSLTPGRWLALSPDCCCDWCCVDRDLHRVHRIFRWFLPLARRNARRSGAGAPAPPGEDQR